ncbi:membrane protease YdiL (CAAX protease family)/SAM-dependent methyltransferase [Microbacteriaceae bacterium SG_E_30_P1]|uniref:Membrane protease YdiL (CAAX protease family)/SAM-dependent methyltransferase n=1 Tax=Antiquaquibacter oligotrophicus TaxID=2880260 RepID=A0ABT6KK44_9MICO|nr:methyltransferase domain-containing protein [Antiquaquibacter oligotrophicus]MDH6180358.1 membrane protease YdiL (CAAX protease family)/SAM-dependent methyltransferase [Antiquaquibacter oligotrophicus]UDF13900.1 methyltransferase domain-containing protein [Antiquaquibacter oligotrophicus]
MSNPEATSFGAAVDVYDAARPEYPREALEWVVPRSAREVVDLGAGTGKFTRLIVESGRTTVAVDPDPVMLERLHTLLPTVDARPGTFEQIPLPDASVDAVVAAQSWHWADAEAGLTEVARVLRPGGTFGLVWNIRDDSVDWVAALGRTIGQSNAEARFEEVARVEPPFGELERAEFRWSTTVTRDDLVRLAASRSSYITADETERARVVAAIDELLATHPDTAGRSEFVLPYVTHCFRSRVSDPPLDYAHALSPARGWWRGALAIVVFVAAYLAVSAVLGAVGFAIEFARGELTLEQLESGLIPFTPVIMLVNNLSLAACIPLALVLQRLFFGARVGSLSSVVGRIRWRWMLRLALIIVPVWALYVGISIVVEPAGEVRIDAGVIIMLAIVVLTTPLQSAGEEYGARGLILRAAESWFRNPTVAFVVGLVISSAVFSLAHLAADWWLIAYYFVFGASAALAARLTGGLEAPVLVHATNNVLLFIPAVLYGQLEQGIDRSEGTGGPFMLFPMIMCVLAALISWRWGHRNGVVTTAPSPVPPRLRRAPAPRTA